MATQTIGTYDYSVAGKNLQIVFEKMHLDNPARTDVMRAFISTPPPNEELVSRILGTDIVIEGERRALPLPPEHDWILSTHGITKQENVIKSLCNGNRSITLLCENPKDINEITSLKINTFVIGT
ncbi:MAG: hypothetical protein KR126chlam5_01468 [Candidatus Anoxychlamydiales bacterium]|nr:hypothetical protein [Candidatus Anoxychlamydiales bacterium]